MNKLEDRKTYSISKAMDFQISLETVEEHPEIMSTLYPEHQEVFELALKGHGPAEIALMTDLRKKMVKWMIQYAIINARYLITRKKSGPFNRSN